MVKSQSLGDARREARQPVGGAEAWIYDKAVGFGPFCLARGDNNEGCLANYEAGNYR
ncbi:MAG: hypothetical protein MK000_00185 [Anaerolineales bacterium]|nr:hypothetical protein [Anaerolineales bacterium]